MLFNIVPLRTKRALMLFNIVPLRSKRALMLFNDISLNTRRALLQYSLYSNSALLLLKGTSLNNDSALLALNWQHLLCFHTNIEIDTMHVLVSVTGKGINVFVSHFQFIFQEVGRLGHFIRLLKKANTILTWRTW